MRVPPRDTMMVCEEHDGYATPIFQASALWGESDFIIYGSVRNCEGVEGVSKVHLHMLADSFANVIKSVHVRTCMHPDLTICMHRKRFEHESDRICDVEGKTLHAED